MGMPGLVAGAVVVAVLSGLAGVSSGATATLGPVWSAASELKLPAGATTAAGAQYAGLIYATGHAIRTARGDWELRLRYLRRVLSGRYTLTLRARLHGRLTTERHTIRLT